jgi:hypothetical protein
MTQTNADLKALVFPKYSISVYLRSSAAALFVESSAFICGSFIGVHQRPQTD